VVSFNGYLIIINEGAKSSITSACRWVALHAQACSSIQRRVEKN
jgi:hypothetical protein